MMVPVRLRSWSLRSTSGARASMLTVTWLVVFSLAAAGAVEGADVVDGAAGAAGAAGAVDCGRRRRQVGGAVMGVVGTHRVVGAV